MFDRTARRLEIEPILERNDSREHLWSRFLMLLVLWTTGSWFIGRVSVSRRCSVSS